MSKDYLSIDISDLRISFVVGKQEGNTINVKKMFSVDNDSGFFREGEIIDVNEFAKIIKDQLKKNKVRTKNAVVTVSPKLIEIKDMTIDKVEEAVIPDMLKLELLSEEVFLDNYEMQFIVDYRAGLEDELSHKVKVYLMNRKLVDDIRTVLKACGLKPAYFDITSNALTKLHSLILDANKTNEEYIQAEREDAAVMYIDLSNEFVQVNVMKGYKQELYRSQENHLYKKQKAGEEIDNRLIDEFIDSIELTTRYYKSMSVGNYIDEVFVYGYSGDKIEDSYAKITMTERLMTNVNFLTHINGIVVGNVDEDTDLSAYFNAINALIRL